MKVKFTLTMDDLTVEHRHYDSVIIYWIAEVAQEEVLEMSRRWIPPKTFSLEECWDWNGSVNRL